MKRFRQMLIAVGIGTVGVIAFGLLKGPQQPVPPSTFWKEPIPTQQIISNALYSGAIAEGRASLIERMQHFGTPGLAVAVAIKEEMVWAEFFGYSDIKSKALVDSLTKFRVGSVSKPFTTLVAKLHEEGKVDLYAPIRTHLPDCAKDRESFTIRQVAGPAHFS